MRFRWGETFLEIIDCFTTPEIREIGRYCRAAIRQAESEYCVEDHAVRINFELFDIDFRLERESEPREWVLHVINFPHPMRRRRRRRVDAQARTPRRRPRDALSGLQTAYDTNPGFAAPKAGARERRVVLQNGPH